MKPLPCLSIAAACVLASCATHAPAPSSSPEREESTGDLSLSTVPVLRSSYLEKNWGLPQITTFRDGGYRLRYRQGSTLNFVFIHGLAKAEPAPATPPPWTENSGDPFGPATPPHPQSWRTATILGKPVKWYQVDDGTGADFPAYKTVDFTATTPDGRTGHYRIEVSCDNPAKVADWIKRVNW